MLRSDTVALFERLREGNILLQEVLSGAHENLSSLEHALVTRVADFVKTMNEVTEKNSATTDRVGEQLNLFNQKTAEALSSLSSLATDFDAHGKAITEAAASIDVSNRRAAESIEERKSSLDNLVTTLDLRTADLDQRLSRFTELLDESLDAASGRAREIAKVIAEAAGAGSTAISRQFEAVRVSAEEERRMTTEAMQEIYEQGTQEAHTMFAQAAERFAGIVQNMKQMTAEMQQELEATRAELRRGVLEMPQEAAESTAQMRKVIVDQIEALAELNRIVARHGRGMDVSSAQTGAAMAEEPMLVSAGGGRDEGARGPARTTRRSSGSTPLPPADYAPPVSPTPAAGDGNRDGWMSELLNRAEPAAPQQPTSALESLALDIARLVDRGLAADMWDRYQRGERKAFSKRLYTSAGQKTFDEVARKYRADRNFKQTVDRYIAEFERLIDEVARENNPGALRSYLASETGLVYTLLAHAAGRLG